MSDHTILAGKGSVKTKSDKSGFLHFCPLFAYLLIFYIIIESFSADVRAVLFTLGTYKLAWVDVFYILAAAFGILEMLKVSEPRVDNTIEAIWIAVAWVVYFLLFILGATGVKILFISFTIFSNTEFLLLTVVSGFQVIAAFRVNSRTIQLQIIE